MGLRKGPPEKGLGPSLTQTHSPWHRWRSVHSEASLTSKGMWAMGTQSSAFDSVSAPTIAVQRGSRGLQSAPPRALSVDTLENGLEIQNPRFQLSKQNKPISGPFPLLETEFWLKG